MRKIIIPIILLLTLALSGCGIKKDNGEKTKDLEYTVVERGGIPAELLSMIDKEKSKEFRLSANIGDYTYIVEGYGCQPTGGYSIRVDEVYETSESVFFHSTLMGPKAGEAVNKLATYPYIVVKIECTQKNINFE